VSKPTKQERADAAEAIERLKALEKSERGNTLQVVEIASLIERAANPNVMSKEHEAALKEAIAKAGFLQPVLARYKPTGLEIIDGVHRVRAARELGYTKVPCIVIHSDEAESIVLQIGMNRMRGELDLRGVAVLLGELSNEGMKAEEMQLTGFSLGEVTDLLGTLKSANPDELPKGPVGGQDDAREPPGEDEKHTLELVFSSKKDLNACKRALKKKGGGDLAVGLLAIIEAIE
jgi:ParB/RepB/Spo0J family partition protein